MRLAPESFHDPGTSYSLTDLPNVFRDYVEINNIDVAKVTVDVLAYAASLIATHSLKLLSPSAGTSFVLKIAPKTGVMPRAYHTGNGAASGNCKIICRPIAIDGTQKARSMADHILVPDEYSETIFASFAEVFGQEGLNAVLEGVSKPANFAENLPNTSFPIVYVPGPDGRELQLTPIVSIETHANMRGEFFPPEAENGIKRYASVTRNEISGKPQNISGAISPTQLRMRADFPPSMKIREADIHRVVNGGWVPAVPQDEILELLEFYTKQFFRLVSPQKGEEYIRFTPERMEQIANRIIDILESHLNEILELCLEKDPSFEYGEIDPIAVLVGRLRIKEQDLALIGRALRGADFQTVLKNRGY